MATTLTLDHVGWLTVGDGIVYYRTDCCKAPVVASEGPTGRACRSCYRNVPAVAGRTWRYDDDYAWARHRKEWDAANGAYYPEVAAENSAVITHLSRVLKRGASVFTATERLAAA